ncbi:hypothetical protein AA0116_g8882 [Alternaria tenuissima]|nr:hypothetical protein AA0116_g8882 [Alternaria tenuissima]
MKASIFALALAGAASAHTTVYSISVNGKSQGLGNVQGGYIDSPPNNNPVTDVTSKAMECNVANIKASKSVAVNGGDKIAVEWHHNNADASDDIIDPSHKGPITVYMSKAGSSMSWTKIAEDGYDGKSWAVEKLIKAKTTLATVAKPAPTAGGAGAQKYGQCGGIGFTGPTTCASGCKCVKQNDWYSQCL